MNVVVFFETIIDKSCGTQIWIVWIDVLFRNRFGGRYVYHPLFDGPFDLIVNLRWIEA